MAIKNINSYEIGVGDSYSGYLTIDAKAVPFIDWSARRRLLWDG